MNLGNEAPALCLWCFDLLSLDGVRITPLPLVERKALLSNLVAMIDDKHLQFWGDFPERAAIIDTTVVQLESLPSEWRSSKRTRE